MSNYDQLKIELNKIFELDKQDLDFGIYRIMNQKRKQVSEFIDNALPKDIKKALSETQSADQAELEKELSDMEKSLKSLDIVAEENPKYIAKKQQLESLANVEAIEQEVFSHLANFFRRYYKDGDFISMRRYKKDVYAIPYEGEEVKLHWANHDQYYIKSSENFKNYSFLLPDTRKKVNFNLKEASTEQNNNKSQGDSERRFAIYEPIPVEEENGELNINFVYEVFPKAKKQEDLIAEAVKLIEENTPENWKTIFALSPTEKNKKRTLLDKYLADFISRNTFDYFIHKDLSGFLTRELDFYIKNEVLFIDDINTQQTEFFTAQLSKIKAIKVVAEKVIAFLAQIENFQKKLWLKKKFVVRTDWLITLDRVPESFYPEILQNKPQLEEWKSLFDVTLSGDEASSVLASNSSVLASNAKQSLENEESVLASNAKQSLENEESVLASNAKQSLKNESFLVLDTKFFSEAFKDKLLAEIEDLDENTNGLLINSENFQALNLLQEKYQEKVDTIYIDPPYNTDANEFTYKDSLKTSSWLSFITDRMAYSRQMMAENANIFISIDDNEVSSLKYIGNNVFSYDNFIGQWNWFKSATPPNLSLKIKKNIEYILSWEKSKNSTKYKGIVKNSKSDDPITKPQNTHKTLEFPNGSVICKFENSYLRKGIYGTEKFPNELLDDLLVENGLNKNTVRFKNKFIWTQEKLNEEIIKGTIFNLSKNGVLSFKKKIYDAEVPPNFIDIKVNVDTTENAGRDLDDMFDYRAFTYPKPTSLISYLINFRNYESGLILDYFAGSGTTGHATIKLNREDGGNRKYILVEMGTYFNTVTKPRIAKVIYSDNWKNGKPQDKDGISQLVKYQVLESYEDTLNNLYVEQTEAQKTLNFSERAAEEYLLHYMLDVESRDHLFNLQMFAKPFDYQLKITENNELIPTKIDLVETFNYLIGLYVSKMQRVKDIKIVEGVTREGVKTLVIWRDTTTTTQEDVEKLIRRFYDSQRTQEFQQIFINGDHHLENIRTEGDQFKVRMIEETFFKKMFNEVEL